LFGVRARQKEVVTKSLLRALARDRRWVSPKRFFVSLVVGSIGGAGEWCRCLLPRRWPGGILLLATVPVVVSVLLSNFWYISSHLILPLVACQDGTFCSSTLPPLLTDEIWRIPRCRVLTLLLCRARSLRNRHFPLLLCFLSAF
jgi:hypothetical protein